MAVKPTFVTDVDGVLFDWNTGFLHWLYDNYNIAPDTVDRTSYNVANWFSAYSCNDIFRFIETFNQSNAAHTLSIIDGSQRAIKRLSADFDIVAVTAFAACENGAALRTQTLMREFTGIKEVVVLPMGSTKRDALERLQPAVFIDDYERYLLESVDLGINTLVMDQPHNRHVNLPRVTHWDNIESVLTSAGVL